ncbi:hypothetical protein PBCVAN69C_467L [Paramecium bursaria Chlorella virus AN69C]|uniref:HNH nuclease domain-containing protein n=1 Tax=Paramecium bursaria Chlorella virus IL3A TaxID=46019 RepID=M1HUQ2_PBCVI|nr:hypothetical protein PBCVAN69C_467L [Paramecium bursaria Chlorella virus AN69C]AGE53919.1 hypothetical protein PBCVIL3A_460L [Paramecium bursaria Chlorella virus IL3A]AGE55333.1 hypothetical protein PBCVMA1E_492L [Paramecium bursaria Chlorella virus MA1E]AGE57348.1 hypothetical protein PBCVNEJV4_464L [Paramecium bursaria Chlorella virus NE-JV-4]
MTTVKYYYSDGREEIFDKYYVDSSGIVKNKKNRRELSQYKTLDGYIRVILQDNNGNRKILSVHRIVASTFIGQPPTPDHSPDHLNRNRLDNTLFNISWKDRNEQSVNRNRPVENKSAFIVVKDGIEKTVKEWVKYYEGEKTPFGNVYTESVIKRYAQRRTNGFSYKIFDDLPGEIWKEVLRPLVNIWKGRWEISNKNRVKRITKFAENVLDVSQLGVLDGYPVINVNGKPRFVHHLSFQAFYPEEYANMKSDEIIRHKRDNKLDFRPENLLLGTSSENGLDAHNNGKYDGTKTERKKCVSYVNGVKEEEHKSLHDAVQYLKENGFKNARPGNISQVLNGKRKTAYGRAWKLVENTCDNNI